MKFLRLLPVLLALATGAVAQDNSAKLALAREVITAAKVDKMFDGIFAQLKQIASQSAAVPASATPEQRQKFEEFQGRVMELAKESAVGMLGQMDQIYADVYSEAELRAMKNFFNSPEGQSMLAKQPQVMAHVMPLVQKMQLELRPRSRRWWNR